MMVTRASFLGLARSGLRDRIGGYRRHLVIAALDEGLQPIGLDLGDCQPPHAKP
jgi:hypothetical protein